MGFIAHRGFESLTLRHFIKASRSGDFIKYWTVKYESLRVRKIRRERIFTAEGAAKRAKQDVLSHPSLSVIFITSCLTLNSLSARYKLNLRYMFLRLTSMLKTNIIRIPMRARSSVGLEYLATNQAVGGSNPSGRAIFPGLAVHNGFPFSRLLRFHVAAGWWPGCGAGKTAGTASRGSPSRDISFRPAIPHAFSFTSTLDGCWSDFQIGRA